MRVHAKPESTKRPPAWHKLAELLLANGWDYDTDANEWVRGAPHPVLGAPDGHDPHERGRIAWNPNGLEAWLMHPNTSGRAPTPSTEWRAVIERADFFDSDGLPLTLVTCHGGINADLTTEFTAHWWDDHRPIDDHGRRSDAGSPGVRGQVFRTDLDRFELSEARWGRRVVVRDTGGGET